MRRLFLTLCILPSLALLSGCADLSRPEQITIIAEKPAPAAPASPAAGAAPGESPAAAMVRGMQQGGAAPKAGGG